MNDQEELAALRQKAIEDGKTIADLRRQVAELYRRVKTPEEEKKLVDLSWIQNPDRMGS